MLFDSFHDLERRHNIVKHLNVGIGFVLPTQKYVCFLKFKRLFHKLMNQYQAYLYSFNAFPMVIPNMVMKFQNLDI